MIQGLVISNPQPNPQFVQLAGQDLERRFLARRFARIEIKKNGSAVDFPCARRL
jgi:hypothetical protein